MSIMRIKRADSGLWSLPRVTAHASGVALVETAMATVVVGVVVVALMQLALATAQQSEYYQKVIVGQMLASQIRELTADLPFSDPYNGTHTSGPDNGAATVSQFNDVEDFQGFTSNPPIDAHRQSMASLSNYKQTVSVQLIGNSTGGNLGSVVNDLNAVVERVTVVVSYKTPASATWTPIVTSVWYKTKY